MNNSDTKYLWYSAGLHFECHKCGRCCSGPEGGYIWVRRPEIQLLANHLSMTPSEFKAKYLRRIGFRLSLKEEPRTRDCVFLQETRGSKSCSIYPVRPAQCRSWPFWPSNLAGPDSWNLAAQRCPGINRGQSFTPDQIQTTQNTKQWWLDENNNDLIQKVQEIYNWLDVQLESKTPDCGFCGRCCDFDAYDHRLFVTTPEMTYFKHKLSSADVIASDSSSVARRAKEEVKPSEISKKFRGPSPGNPLDFSGQSQLLEIERLPRRPDSSGLLEMTTGRCPYQVEGSVLSPEMVSLSNHKCTVYPYRFAGCRIFSCKGDPDFQSALTESVIKKFKHLCDEFEVPYRYVDLPTALNTFSPPHT